MNVKYSKGKVFGAGLSAKERKGMELEIKRQIIKMDLEHKQDIDALILYVLHSYLGFGKKRLHDFYINFAKEHKALLEYYELNSEADNVWLCKQKLKDIGVDIDEWEKEVLYPTEVE